METYPLPRSIYRPADQADPTPAAVSEATPARPEAVGEDCQINWLEMARFAAEGEGHRDLQRGVRRLATLAAAAHRFAAARAAGLDRPSAAVCGAGS